ncbi:MAG: GNAT family N-acetyltransferase [Acidimicrobiales bacterium]
MSLSIREATGDDAEEIVALTRELAGFEHLADEVRCTADQVRRTVADGLVHVSLGEVGDGVAAGHALWFPTFSTFLGQTGIWLEDLYVRPPHRGRGYGRALLEHLRARTDGRVEWEVLDWNERAIAVYEHLGAEPVRGWTRYRWAPTG